MPRVKWNVRCTAHRPEDKMPCEAWAVRGGYVCAAHGGRQPRTRNAAQVRLMRSVLERAFARAWAEHQRRFENFHINRIITAAELLGKPIREIDRWDIVECHLLHGVPPLEDQAPKVTDVKLDRRITRYLDYAHRGRR